MPFARDRASRRGHRTRRDRRRRRRRRPRERGRPHHRGREDDARDDGVHDPPHERRDLHAGRGRPARRAAAPADGRRQHRVPAHRVHGVGRRPSRHHHRHLGRRPVHDRARPSSTPPPAPRTSPVPATSSRSATGRAACSSAPATPRPRSTSPASPACEPAGVLAEIVNDDGTMARLPDLERFAAEHDLVLISIADLIRYRRRREKLVRRVSEARIPTLHGDFTALRVRVAARRHRALRVRAGRGRGQGQRAGARALRVPHR